MSMTSVQFLRTSPPEGALQMWARGRGIEHGGPSFDATLEKYLTWCTENYCGGRWHLYVGTITTDGGTYTRPMITLAVRKPKPEVARLYTDSVGERIASGTWEEVLAEALPYLRML